MNWCFILGANCPWGAKGINQSSLALPGASGLVLATGSPESLKGMAGRFLLLGANSPVDMVSDRLVSLIGITNIVFL